MRNWLVSFFLLALLGWLLTATVQGTTTLAPVETPAATPTIEPTQNPAVLPTVTASPTIDRLAAPPTVENPTQVDEGAQLFWLHCQPCHGDVGQGLTDEWRAQYPEEDQNCWMSGCHGNRPYENGFTLPTAVPAVTGDDSLARFETMGQVYGFISSAMPYQNPGYLTEEEYLAMAAFLARAHGVWDGTPLTTGNVSEFRLRPASTPTAVSAPTTTAPEPEESDGDRGGLNIFFVGLAAGVIGSLAIIAVLIKRRL